MKVSADPKTAFSVLIVEDNLSACNIICRTVSMRFPFAVIYSADNGITGLELFKKHTPDIVVTDISMPEMNGLEMAAEIQSLTSDTSFIVFTGHSEGDYLKNFNEIGIYHYLLKPLDLAELISTINECLKARHLKTMS